MRYRQVGNSGLTVSVVGIGCNNFGRGLDQEQSRVVVQAGLDVGVTHFDTAELYGEGKSEEFLGAALRGHRHEVVIATKFGNARGAVAHMASGSRRAVRQRVEASLRRLNTDYIDLYYLHEMDPKTPMVETLRAMGDLVREGKVRYLACSQAAAWQVADAEWLARSHNLERFVAVQNQYSLLERAVEQELQPACLHYGIGLVPFFPLASGLLTGKYKRGEAPPPGSRMADRPGMFAKADLARLARVEDYAAERGLRMLQVAIGGLAAQPAVPSVIAGAMTPEQVRQNVEAGEWEPTAAELEALNAL